MSVITVSAAKLGAINFAPGSLEEEVAQNVRCILSTRRGSVPLDRNFGLDPDYIDRPQPLARQMAEADIVVTLAQYEPRATVSEILWERADEALDGALYPKVLLLLKEGAA